MTFIVDGTNGLTFPNSTTQVSSSKVLQVVNATYGTTVSNSSTSYVDTGLTASITPLFSTSKVLVLSIINGLNIIQTSSGLSFQLVRGSTSLYVFGTNYLYGVGNNPSTIAFNYLDSPATTSSTTYKVQFATTGNTNTSYVNTNSGLSSIVLMEIAA